MLHAAVRGKRIRRPYYWNRLPALQACMKVTEHWLAIHSAIDPTRAQGDFQANMFCRSQSKWLDLLKLEFEIYLRSHFWGISSAG